MGDRKSKVIFKYAHRPCYFFISLISDEYELYCDCLTLSQLKTETHAITPLDNAPTFILLSARSS